MDNVFNVTFNGKINTILSNGIVKEYPIGGMMCEYARLKPYELKEIFDSYPDRNKPKDTEKMGEATMWLLDKLMETQDTVTALMCITEVLNGVSDLFKAKDDELRKLLNDANNDDETKKIRDFILKDTGASQFNDETIGDLLSYGYYIFALQYSIFRASFDVIMKSAEAECEGESYKGDDEATLNMFGTMYQVESLNYQHFDFKIIAMEGKFESLYSINNSLSLLLFETAHLIESETLVSKCKNCGHYFINTGRSDTVYCNYPSPQDSTRMCNEIGAQITRAEKVKNDEATKLYRRIYMRNKMLQTRHPGEAKYGDILHELVEGAKKWRKILKNSPERNQEYLDWISSYDNN